MADLPQQNFVDRVGPVVGAAWLNEVDQKRLLLKRSAGGLLLGTPIYAFKANQTIRFSTITLTDDPDLQFPAMPAGTYRVQGFLQFQGSISGGQGFSSKIAIAGGIAGSSWLAYHGIANATALGDILADPATSAMTFSTISTSLTDFVSFDVIATIGAGEISLQWAQHASNANGTILNDRSWMAVTPLA